MSEERAEWLEKKERGSPWILSTTFKIARFVGRGPMKRAMTTSVEVRMTSS